MMKTEKGAESMVTRRQANVGLVASAVIASTTALAAQDAKAIELPPPRTAGGKL
jgi:hypothetical protein